MRTPTLLRGAPSFAPALPVAPASFAPTMMLAEGPAEVAMGEELMSAAEEVAEDVAKAGLSYNGSLLDLR